MMFKILAVFALCCAGAIPAQAQFFPVSNLQPAVQQNMAAYYKVNEGTGTTTADSSGTRTGTLVNTPTWTTGKFSNALQFNGSNQVVTMASPALTSVTSWTLAAWIYPTSISQYGNAVTNAYDNGSTGNGFSLGIGSGSNSAGAVFQGLFDGVAFYNTGYSFGAANTWYHVIITCNGGTTSAYVNGVATPNTSTATPNTPTAMSFGGVTGGAPAYFAGKIDDVRYYARGFSATDAKNLANLIP